jgi:hypothetical protein
VIRTPDGRLFIINSSTKLGQRVSVGALDERANRQASAQLRDAGYNISTGQVSAYTVRREYLVTTIQSRR